MGTATQKPEMAQCASGDLETGMNLIERWYIMNWLKNWVKSHTVFAHTVAVIAAAGVTAYSADPQFAALVRQAYAQIPPQYQAWVGLAVALWAWYKKNETQGGTQ